MIDDQDSGSPRHWLLVAAMVAIYIYAFVDRVILALVVEPIRHDLGATDGQMGLLLGVGFAVLFGIFGVPAGALVDRFNRYAMIALASVLWALMTILCGLAQSVGMLFVGRSGVGIAEAFVLPAAFSLIQDAVPARSRALAFSIFAMAPLAGATLSLLGGGKLLGFAAAGGFAGWPVLDGLAAWRTTLVVTGVAGIPLSLMLLLAPQPTRIAVAAAGGRGLLAELWEGLAAAARFMRDNRAVYVPLVLFATVGSMSNLAASSWSPALLGRAWQLTPQQVGPMLGGVLLVCGLGGLTISGVILTRLTARGRDIRTYGVIAAVGTMLGFVGVGFAPSLGASLASIGLGAFFMGTSYSVAASTLSEVTPRPVMGRVTALYFMVQSVFGHALAPLFVGIASERLFTGRFALSHAFALCCAAFGAGTIASVLVLRRRLAARRSAA